MPIQCVSVIYPPVNFKNVFRDNATKLIRSVRRTCFTRNSTLTRVVLVCRSPSPPSDGSSTIAFGRRRQPKSSKKIGYYPPPSHITPHQDVNLQPTILDTLNGLKCYCCLKSGIKKMRNPSLLALFLVASFRSLQAIEEDDSSTEQVQVSADDLMM
jgi:hypothetical protein